MTFNIVAYSFDKNYIDYSNKISKLSIFTKSRCFVVFSDKKVQPKNIEHKYLKTWKVKTITTRSLHIEDSKVETILISWSQI